MLYQDYTHLSKYLVFQNADRELKLFYCVFCLLFCTMKTILIALFYCIWGSFAEDVYTAVYNYNKGLITDNSVNNNVSRLCRDQLQQYASGLENYKPWALFSKNKKIYNILNILRSCTYQR